MQYDEIINCPKSGGDLCYKLRVTDEITNYFSLSCGFWTNSLMTPGSDFFEEQIEMLPELYKDLSWVDEKTGLIWLPTTINEEQLGIEFDYIESELIAYLSARSIYNLPITFPSTTGVSKPSSGGNLYNYL